MCNSDLNTIIDLGFSSVNDEFNWSTTSLNPIITEDDKLVLQSDGSTVGFKRNLGVLRPTNNRIRVRSNFEIQNTQESGATDMDVFFQIMVGSSVIHEGCVEFSEISENTLTGYFLDRTFKYDSPIVAPITLNITAQNGWQNKILLKDLSVVDFNFCEDNVRTYFVVDQLLEDSLTSQASGIQLLEWKIDGVETLTQDFFNEVQVNGGVSTNDWNYAKAQLDGTLRDNNLSPFNTFNPFIREFGLTYDVGTYFGGLPTGTQTGSDYGQGILKIGFEKPAILNGNLDEKNGAFFIDIDYTKTLKVVFNVILNQDSSNLYSRPTTFREYTIEWNALTCEKLFYYKDKLIKDQVFDVLVDGFLSGLTGIVSSDLVFNQDTKILMYFDSSGSMNSTLAPLTTMKDTLLRQRLLPFYNNDDVLYNESVTITNVSDERTMRSLDMLQIPPPNGNVVVFVFQDEAQSIYHGSQFTPRTSAFDTDIANLRTRLNSYAPGYYRAVLFHVTGNAIYPQFIQSIQQGIAPYNGVNGLSDRIEFGYDYDVQDGGTPQYYLDLVVAALQNLGYAV